MDELTKLQQLLQQKNTADATLAGLDEQYARANALRDNGFKQPDSYGVVSPLQVMADLMGKSRGRQQVRKLQPQREQARQASATAASALPLYSAKIAADKTRQQQQNWQQTFDAGRSDQAQRQTNFEAQQQRGMTEARNPVELVSVNDPNDVMHVYEYGGRYFDANDQPVNTEGYQVRQRSYATGYNLKPVKSEDEYGNKILVTTDKSTGLQTVTFADGTPYNKELAPEYAARTATQAGNVTFAKEGSKRDQKRLDAINTVLGSSRSMLSSLDQALTALDNGANSGPIMNSLPKMISGLVSGQNIALENARQKMGLAELGQVTMGSLSNAEGDWLKEVSIPPLDEDELRPYLEHRYEATLRLMEALDYEAEALRAREPVKSAITDHILTRKGFDIRENGWERK